MVIIMGVFLQLFVASSAKMDVSELGLRGRVVDGIHSGSYWIVYWCWNTGVLLSGRNSESEKQRNRSFLQILCLISCARGHFFFLSFLRLSFIFSFLCISESVSRRHFPCSLLFPLFPTCASFLFGLDNNGEPLTPADTRSCFVYLKPLHNTAAISFLQDTLFYEGTRGRS